MSIKKTIPFSNCVGKYSINMKWMQRNIINCLLSFSREERKILYGTGIINVKNMLESK